MILLLLLSLIATFSIILAYAIQKGNGEIISNNHGKILKCERIIRTESGRYISLDNIKSSDKWHELNDAEKRAVREFFQKEHLAEPYLSILYQPKKRIAEATKIMIDCFDGNGNLMEGRFQELPTSSEPSKGEIRKIKVKLPSGTAAYEIRFEDIRKG